MRDPHDRTHRDNSDVVNDDNTRTHPPLAWHDDVGTQADALPPFNGGFNGGVPTRFPAAVRPQPRKPTHQAASQPAPQPASSTSSTTSRTPSQALRALNAKMLETQAFSPYVTVATPEGQARAEAAAAKAAAEAAALAAQLTRARREKSWSLVASGTFLAISLVAAGALVGPMLMPRSDSGAINAIAPTVVATSPAPVDSDEAPANVEATAAAKPAAPASKPTPTVQGSSVQQPATNVKTNPAPAASITPAAVPGQIPAQSAFGTTLTWKDGVTVAVAAPKPYQPSPTAELNGQDPRRVYVFDCVVHNSGNQPFHAYDVVFLPTSSAYLLNRVIDPAGGVPDVPRSVVPVGGTISFKIAVAAPAGPFLMTVGNGVSLDPTPVRYSTTLT